MINVSGQILDLSPGQHIVWIGNTLAERMQEYGHLETEMHALHPQHKLVIRNLAWSADTVTLRPRPQNFGDIHRYLGETKADVILACYGLNETWDYDGETGLARFETDLGGFVRELRGGKYNGKTAPKIILFSPIACEDSGIVPDIDARNRLLQLYAKAMARVAAREGVGYVDLFTPSHGLMVSPDPHPQHTRNGIHLTGDGYAMLSSAIGRALFGKVSELSPERRRLIRREVLRKNRTFFDHYRAVNSVHIHGQRVRPFGSVNFPDERQKLMQMTALRDARIWDAVAGKALAHEVDDSTTRTIPATVPDTGNVPLMPTPQQAEKNFTLAEGFEVNLFASEVEFPDLKNPSSMLFDARGRLWVSTMPSYPHALPGVAPNDKILILEDTDADGKADKKTVFADGLYLPLGFEIGYGGAFVSQEPNLVFLKDTNGDGKADERTILLSGFGTEDSHHAIHDFIWDGCGGLYMQESVFLHSQVETPYGPRRLVNAGMHRFDPRTWKLEMPFRLNGGGNAWGHSIDRWGAHLFVGHYLNPALVNQGYPGFRPSFRKTTGDNRFCEQEFITSRHFPDEYQGKVFSNIYKHYHGLRLHDWTENGSGYTHDKLVDVLKSSSTSHIPVDLCLGPDGALYIADWTNQVLGHMQASIREIKRDHDHGRIWRVTYKDRPLATPPKLAGQPLPVLLDSLKAYEDRTRYRARRLLWEVPDAEMKPALAKWVADLDPADTNVAHHRVEALWLHQQRGWVNPELLEAVLKSPAANARAAATDLLRFWSEDLPDARSLFLRSAADANPKVRLAAVVSATWASPDIAIAVLDLVDSKKKDPDLGAAVSNARKALAPIMKTHPMLAKPADLATMPMSKTVVDAIIRRVDLPVELRMAALERHAKTQSKSLINALLGIIVELDKTDARSLPEWLAMLKPSKPLAVTASATVKGPLITVSHPAISSAPIDSITFSVPGDGKIINLCELEVYSGGKNVAGSAHFQMSSQHDNYQSANLVDGDKSTFAHTSTEANPWIKATFSPALQGVGSVKLWNRRGYESRFDGALIRFNAGIQPVATVMVKTAGTKPSKDTVLSNPKMRASYDRISAQLSAQLSAGVEPLTILVESKLQPAARQALIAAVLRAGKSVATTDADYFRSIALLDDATQRQTFAQQALKVLADNNAPVELRLAAIFALGRVPGDDAAMFDRLSLYLDQDELAAAAADALLARSKASWPQAKAVALMVPQFRRLQETPVTERGGPRFSEASRLLMEIASFDGAGISRAAIDALQLKEIEIATVPNLLTFKTKRFEVKAGAPIALRLMNDDAIDHNLVIVSPGALEKVGMAADAMAAQPDAADREWVPEMPEVLVHTALVKPTAAGVLRFMAPKTPGEYPFLCSVPGHWRLMQGVMLVR
jgi:glucose/arabinose dehydrogenase/uncharacterized cupredoxin-like copper-binding protein/lysophospholipase L1-like esterase